MKLPKCFLKNLLTITILCLSIYTPRIYSRSGVPCENLFEDENNIVVQTKLSRAFGLLLNEHRVLENLEKITGIKPILDQYCMTDRCQEANKDYFRAYLLSSLEELHVSKEDVFFEYNKRRFSWSELALEQKNEPENSSHPEPTKANENTALWEMMDTIFSSFNFLFPTTILNQRNLSDPSVNLPPSPQSYSQHLKNWLSLKELMRKKSYESLYSSQASINILVEHKGTTLPSPIIELNAHYDTVYNGVPGADDNGSGTVLLMESLHLLKEIQTNKTIRLVFADHEERGFIGTSNHVDIIKENQENVEAAFVVDMFAYHPNSDASPPQFVVEISGDKISEHTNIISNNRTLVNTFFNQSFSFPRVAQPIFAMENALPGTADHGPYWRKSIPAILISSRYHGEFINPGYHSSSDTIKNYKFPYFYSIAQQTLEALVRLAEISKFEDLEATKSTSYLENFSLQEKNWMEENIQMAQRRKSYSKENLEPSSHVSETLSFQRQRSKEFLSSKKILNPHAVKSLWESYTNWLKTTTDPSIDSISDSFPKSLIESKKFLVPAGDFSTPDNRSNTWYRFTDNFVYLLDSELQKRDQFLNTSIEISRTRKSLYLRIGSLLLRYFKDQNNKLQIEANWYSPYDFKNSKLDSLILRLNYLDLEGPFAQFLFTKSSEMTDSIHLDELSYELIVKFHEITDLEAPLDFAKAKFDFTKQMQTLLGLYNRDEKSKEIIFGVKRSL